jgi:hypothetical protein
MLPGCYPRYLPTSIYAVSSRRLSENRFDERMTSVVTVPSYNSHGQYTAPIMLFAFLIGLFCS